MIVTEELITLLLYGLFNVLAWWKPTAVLFIILDGYTLILALTWRSAYPTTLGMAVSIVLLAYFGYLFWMVCKTIFWHKKEEGD